MNIIELPSGNKVTLRDVKSVKSGERDDAIRNLDIHGGELALTFDLVKAVAQLLVESWTFDLIPPNIRPESLRELDLDDADAFRMAILPFAQDLMPRFEQSSDPKATTPNSNESVASTEDLNRDPN